MTNFTQIPNRIIDSEVVSSKAKLVYMVLARYNPSRPSKAVIVKQTGLSKRSVTAAIIELVGLNIISYKRGSKASKRCNEYTVHPENQWVLKSIGANEHPSKDVVLDSPLNERCGAILTQDVVLKGTSNNTKNNTNSIKAVIRGAIQHPIKKAVNDSPIGLYLVDEVETANHHINIETKGAVQMDQTKQQTESDQSINIIGDYAAIRLLQNFGSLSKNQDDMLEKWVPFVKTGGKLFSSKKQVLEQIWNEKLAAVRERSVKSVSFLSKKLPVYLKHKWELQDLGNFEAAAKVYEILSSLSWVDGTATADIQEYKRLLAAKELKPAPPSSY